jgi:hypothetical protein
VVPDKTTLPLLIPLSMLHGKYLIGLDFALEDLDSNIGHNTSCFD